MKTFEDLKFKIVENGVVGTIELENGAKISVAQTETTYGGKSGLWEICVFKSKDSYECLGLACFEGGHGEGWLTTKELCQRIIDIQEELGLN